MEATEIEVIDEHTSDAKLPDACPICEGRLDVRVSPDGVFTWCGHCHLIGRGDVLRNDDGLALSLRAHTVA